MPYIKKAVKIGFGEKDTISFTYYISTFGEAYLAGKRYDLAKPLLIQSLRYAEKFDRRDLLGNVSNDLSQLFYETGMFDSSIKYARQGIYYTTGQSTLMDAYEWVYKSFEKQNQNDSASKYFRLAVNIRDSLFSIKKQNCPIIKLSATIVGKGKTIRNRANEEGLYKQTDTLYNFRNIVYYSNNCGLALS